MADSKLTGFAAELRAFALSLPETTEDFPWGERAFKVKGKAFVFMSAEELRFSMKLPETGNQALVLPFADPTHYGLGKHGWITFSPTGRITKALKEQFLDWARESYRAVAPKKLARALDEEPPKPTKKRVRRSAS
jgi:predicted DNA-binding protein (MmcQ/YjbR family)